jgi:hypothetical protein
MTIGKCLDHASIVICHVTLVNVIEKSPHNGQVQLRGAGLPTAKENDAST